VAATGMHVGRRAGGSRHGPPRGRDGSACSARRPPPAPVVSHTRSHIPQTTPIRV